MRLAYSFEKGLALLLGILIVGVGVWALIPPSEDAGHSLGIEAPEEFQRRLLEKLLPPADE